MECPHCGKTDNKVIDSRSTQEGIAIRRRRHCLACAGRFTTYETTEEQLLRVFVWKDARAGSAINTMKAVLNSLENALKTLTEEAEKLNGRVKKFDKAQAEAARKPKSRAVAKVRVKKKARVKKP